MPSSRSFTIDDKQVLRAMIDYPLTTGRNVGEIVRLVKALQISEKFDVTDWSFAQKPLPVGKSAARTRMRG